MRPPCFKACCTGLLVLISLVAALIWSRSTLALDANKAITQYTQDVWTSENGLPQNSIWLIVQTRDGYLWLATDEGLARFDGARFTVFDKTNTDQIKNNSIRKLYEDKAGNLWIGTQGGLSRYKDGEFTSFTTKDGLAGDVVRSIYEDREGNLWIGTQGGLSRYKDGEFTSFTTKDGLASDVVLFTCEDKAGNLWIGTREGLSRFRDEKITPFTTRDGLINDVVSAMLEDKDGNLWFGTDGGLSRFKDGKVASFTTRDGLASNVVYEIHEDRQGSLWVDTKAGLNRLKDGKITSLTTRDGLSSDLVRGIYEDREGSLWIRTRGGLNRLKDGKITSFTAKDGLSNDLIHSVFEDKEGSFWVGTQNGLNRLKDGKFSTFTTKEGLSNQIVWSIYEDKQGNLWICTQGGLNRFKDGKFTAYTSKDGLSNDFVTVLYEDKEGSLWIGAEAGLNRLKDGKFTSYTAKDGLSNDYVIAIYGDKDGSLWVGTGGGGLNRFKDGKFTAYTTENGLSSNFVYSLYEGKDGSLWVGTGGGGLDRLKDGKITSFTTKDGLSNNYVYSIYEDTDESLWIATAGGLNRFKDGKITAYTTREGLFDDALYVALEDNDRNLWMTCNKGIFRVSKSELNDFADGRISLVRSVVYGTADGLRSRECNQGSPAGWKTRDGKLWFPTIMGVAVIDPTDIRINALSPPVVIEKVVIDGKPVSPKEKLQVPPGAGDLEFQYTALSLLAPEKVSFKYKLEGYDKDWVDAGTRRTSYYTNIPPGEYSFKVIACNNDGVWNETGASLGFYLKPHFYQTYWFYGLCCLGLILTGAQAYRARIKHFKARREELETLIAERTNDLLEVTRSLQESNRRQADFVSGVTHELKTPLTLIRLYGETLEYSEGFSEDERQSYYRIITRESERLTHMIENVLDFTRIDQGQKGYRFREGDIAPVVKRTVESYSQHLLRQGFTIKVDLATDLPLVRFDEYAVIEAVLNLIDNAAKFSGQSKFVCVRLYSKGSRMFLEVEDTGIGIPRGEQDKLFRQFYRGSNDGAAGGYGLGLFLVKNTMDAHGGAVEIESDVGRGSLFRLIFPLSKPDEGEKTFAAD